MAFTEFYCNPSTGSNMNGGSDENASPSYSATNGGWNSGTGVFTPTSGDPSASVTVGQFAHVFSDGSTTPTFIGRVTAVNATTVTVSTSAKSGTAPGTSATGISINVGGVWKGPNGASGFPFGFVTNTLKDASSNPPRVNFKNNATYSITAAMSHGNAGITFQGYASTAGDGGKATVDGGSSGASYVLLSISAAVVLQDFVLQNNGASGTATGLAMSSAGFKLVRVVVSGVYGHGFSLTAAGRAVECEAFGCTRGSSGAFLSGFQVTSAVNLVRCSAHDNTATSNSHGFGVSGSGASLVGCISDSNAGKGIWDNSGAPNVEVLDCVVYNNTSGGIYLDGSASTTAYIENCIISSNGGYGVSGNSSGLLLLSSNAFYNNTSGQTSNINASLITGSVTLTGDPFTDAANGDFSLNSTAGAGAACRGAGRGAFTTTQGGYGTTTAYPDIGAVQHQDSGGNAGMLYVPNLDGV